MKRRNIWFFFTPHRFIAVVLLRRPWCLFYFALSNHLLLLHALQKCAKNNRTSECYLTPLHCLSSLEAVIKCHTKTTRLFRWTAKMEIIIRINPHDDEQKSAYQLLIARPEQFQCQYIAIKIRTNVVVYFGTCEKNSTLADWLLWQRNGKFLYSTRDDSRDLSWTRSLCQQLIVLEIVINIWFQMKLPYRDWFIHAHVNSKVDYE